VLVLTAHATYSGRGGNQSDFGYCGKGNDDDEGEHASEYDEIKDDERMAWARGAQATHAVALSPSGRAFFDVGSRVDAAPVASLRCATTGRALAPVARADLRPLEAQGWCKPEPFAAPGRSVVRPRRTRRRRNVQTGGDRSSNDDSSSGRNRDSCSGNDDEDGGGGPDEYPTMIYGILVHPAPPTPPESTPSPLAQTSALMQSLLHKSFPWWRQLPYPFLSASPSRDNATTHVQGGVKVCPPLRPDRSCAVVENVYAGPHDAHCPKAFGLLPGMQVASAA
jgi:hypothetical protein